MTTETKQVPAAVDYGRRLEPRGRAVLHGIGQDHDTFVEYSRIIGDRKPSVYMAYIGLQEGYSGKGVEGIVALEKRLQALPGQYVAVQLGCGLRSDEILSGALDEALVAYCRALRDTRRPIYLRLGFEFNGHWNNYDPEKYRPAWIRFAEVLRAERADNVALVWCYVPDGADHDWMKWYPGDEYVDWWSFDPFSVQDITDGDTRRFIAQAAERRFPVMIGESTPRWVGVQQGELTWRVWFQRYFSAMEEFPHIKGFCYIAWNWKDHIQYETSPYSWHWWGDGRVWADDYVFQHWQEELAKPMYVHASDRAALADLLRMK